MNKSPANCARSPEVGEPPRAELIRLVLEQSFLTSHRRVFGVLIWFCLLAVPGLGPAGAVFYRLAEVVAGQWNPDARVRAGAVSAPLARVAARFPDANDDVILAVASGAMNVRLGGAQSAADPLPGERPASRHIARAVGLLWRLLALWLLLTLVHVLG